MQYFLISDPLLNLLCQKEDAGKDENRDGNKYACIGIIAVGRDDLKWNEEVQTQQRYCLWKEVIACGRKLLALISFRVCSLVDGDHFFCRTEKIYGQTWIRDGPMSNYSNQSTDIPLNSSNE